MGFIWGVLLKHVKRIAGGAAALVMAVTLAAYAQAATDRSDAPSSYGEADHTFSASHRLGATNDADAASILSIDATGDGASDDGVTLPTLTQGSAATVTITVTGAGGRLQAWFDWNADGDFADAGEQVATNISDGGAGDTNAAAGTLGVSVTVPATAATATFARLRWSTTSGLSSNATASDGEVEDYAVTVRSNGDRGDAPATYGNPTHSIVAGIRLGAIDPDVNATPIGGVNASNDDTTGTDDEDGVTMPAYFTAGYTSDVPITVAGSGGYLQLFIDWDRDGDFSDSGEQAAANVQDNGAGDTDPAAGAITLSVPVPASASAGTSYLRARWSTVSGLNATTPASNGEVEDYRLNITKFLPAAGSSSCTGANLLSNGSFEIPDYNMPPPYFYLEPESNVTGWANSAENVIEIWDSGYLNVPSYTGNQYIELNATVAANLSASIPVQPYAEFTVSWAHRGRSGVDTASLNYTDNGGGSLSYGNFATGNTAWQVYAMTGLASAAASNATLTFAAVSTASGSLSIGNFLDEVELCQTFIAMAKAFSSKSDVDGNGIDSAGDLINYQYQISNAAGNHKAVSSVQIIDDKIGTINVPAPASGDVNGNGVLNQGETWTVNASHTITQSDINAAGVANIAYAQGSTGANTLRSTNQSVSVPLARVPLLVLQKDHVFITDTGAIGEADKDDVIRYTFTVANTGNVVISGISVNDAHNHTGAFSGTPGNAALTDNAPAGDSSGAPGGASWASLAPNDIVTFSQDYTVVQSDIDLLQ